MKPDWPIDIETLQKFIECKARKDEIVTNPDETDRLTAARVTVLPEVIFGTVAKIDDIKRLITTEDGDTIFVPDEARIIKLNYCRNADKEEDNDHQDDIDFSDIEIGDKIKAYGHQECPLDDPDAVFDSYMMIVRPAPQPPTKPDPDTIVIRRNKVTKILPASEYDKNLVIEGNKVRVIGRAGEDCESSEGWTVKFNTHLEKQILPTVPADTMSDHILSTRFRIDSAQFFFTPSADPLHLLPHLHVWPYRPNVADNQLA